MLNSTENVAIKPPEAARGEDILAGYRTDAIDQLTRLREMLNGPDLLTIPDMEAFHLSACCELCRQKVVNYFNLRNAIAEARVKEAN